MNLNFSPCRRLGLDLVIRDEQGGVQNPTLLSTVALHRLHEVATQRIITQQETSVNMKQSQLIICCSYLAKNRMWEYAEWKIQIRLMSKLVLGLKKASKQDNE